MAPSVLHTSRTACLGAGDEPLAPLQAEVQPPTPVFSFCKLANFSDIMLPNTIEGDVFLRPPDKRAFRPKPRAGRAPPTFQTIHLGSNLLWPGLGVRSQLHALYICFFHVMLSVVWLKPERL